jgi:DNA-binding LytR/AlgR family response regulator
MCMNTGDVVLKMLVKLVTATAIHVIPVNEIVYCEESFTGTVFYQTNDHRLFVDLPFHEVEIIMKSYSFWSASKNCMINLNYLDEIPIGNEKPVIKLEKYKLPVDKDRINLLVDVLRIIG